MANNFDTFPDLDLLIGLMFGEGRMVELGGADETIEFLAIGCTVRNRVNKDKRFPNNYKDVILQPKQFSCYNDNDPNYNRIYKFLTDPEDKNDRLYNQLEHLADLVWNDRCTDFSNGADHYVAKWLYDKYPPATNKWYYKYTLTAVAGGHMFFRESKV